MEKVEASATSASIQRKECQASSYKWWQSSSPLTKATRKNSQEKWDSRWKRKKEMSGLLRLLNKLLSYSLALSEQLALRMTTDIDWN